MTCLKPEGALPGASGANGLDFNPFDIMQPRAPGAVPLPLGRIRAQGAAAIDALGVVATDASEILLVCHSGMRSRTARAVLASDARRRYVNVSGGMAAWAAAGLPMIQGRR